MLATDADLEKDLDENLDENLDEDLFKENTWEEEEVATEYNVAKPEGVGKEDMGKEAT